MADKARRCLRFYLDKEIVYTTAGGSQCHLASYSVHRDEKGEGFGKKLNGKRG